MLNDIDRRLLAKRVCILASIVAFWVLAALTASLPLNSPSTQYKQGYQYLDPLYPDLNSGDTAWMVVASILGLMLTPILAFFYGSIEGRSSSSLVYVCVVTVAAIAMLWILFGFSLVFGEDVEGNHILGDPFTYYMFKNVGAAPEATLAPTIPLSIFAIYELSFAILAPTIIACSLIGRVNMVGWLFYICCWHLVVYCPVAHIVWTPAGWFTNHYIRDFSGGIVVNMVAGVSALSNNFILGPRRNIEVKVEPNAPNVLTSLILLWLTWFSLNAGKAHGANAVAAQSIVNTMASCCASILMWIFLDFLVHKKSTLVSVANSLLVSLITMTPSSGYFTAGGAIVATIFSVLLTYAFGYLYTFELQDPKQTLSVLTLHGFTGTLGVFLTSIFSYQFINQGGTDGLTSGQGIAVAFQIAAIVLLIPLIFLGNAAVFLLADKVVPIRSEDEYAASSESDAGGSQASSSSIAESSTSTVEMFDLFSNGDEETQFIRSDALIGDYVNDAGTKQAEKDSAVRAPDRVTERNMEEAGYSSVSDSMRAAFRTELQDFIMSKMKPRYHDDQFEAAI